MQLKTSEKNSLSVCQDEFKMVTYANHILIITVQIYCDDPYGKNFCWVCSCNV